MGKKKSAEGEIPGTITITRASELRLGDKVLRRSRKRPPKPSDVEYTIRRIWRGDVNGSSLMAECQMFDGSTQTRSWHTPEDLLPYDLVVIRE